MTKRTDSSGATRGHDERLALATRLRQVDLTMERRREKQILYGWLDAFSHRPSQILVIEGPDGSGKAQLLKKAARRSQNRNILFVSKDAREADGPYGIFGAWIEAIRLSDLPANVAQELSAFVSTRRMLSVLTGQTNDLPTQAGWRLPSPDRGSEQKDQLTAELVRFFTITARHRPLLLAVSNYDRLEPGTQSLVERVFAGLSQAPVGLITTANTDSIAAVPLISSFDATTLSVAPLNTLQIQGLLRQVCKRHHLTDAFTQNLEQRTEGIPSRVLLTLWYLIETRYLVFTKNGWGAPAAIPWASLPEDLHRQVATRVTEVSKDAAALLKGLAIASHHASLSQILEMLDWDRDRFDTARNEINAVFPVLSPVSARLEPLVSTGILSAVRAHCTTPAEQEAWSHRIASFLADSARPNLHEEIAEIYDAGGRGDAALTYRIAAAHRAKSIACYDRAAHNLREGLRHCEPETGLHARLLLRLGDVQSLRGETVEARQCADDATRIATTIGSLRLEADAKFFLSGLETSEGNLAEGLVKLDQSLALYKASGRKDGLLAVLGRMATVYRELRMWPQSDAINDEMLTLAELESNPLRLATSHINAAISMAVRGERSRAAENLYRSLRLCRKHGYWDLITFALIDFADAIRAGSDTRDLDRYYVAAVASARRRFDEIRELEALYKLAESYIAGKAHRKARTTAHQVIEQAEARGETRYRGEATRIAGICAWKQGNSEEAGRLFSSALEIAESSGDERIRAKTLADKGDWASAVIPDQAEAAWREARNIFCRLGMSAEVLRMDRNLIRHTYEHARPPARYSHAV